MEKPKSHLRAPGQRSSTGDFALRPATSVYSQPEQQISSRSESIRPPTSSTSSQSGTQAEWDPAGHSYYGSRATTSSEIDDLNLEPDEFWPQTDSEDDSGGDGGGGNTLKRTTTTKSGSTSRKLKAMLQKFGRQYNNHYDFLPNDAQEKDRNALQHDIVLEILDGKLHLAPVVNARKVLDLGCGPGNWPLDFSTRNPKTLVLGIDIDPIRPPFNLPNCRFQVADFYDKWSYGFKFDFIHLRHLGNIPKKELLITIYENLSPGGWAEFTEWVVAIQSTHKSVTETSFHKWLRYWKSGLKKMGKTVYYPLEYKRLLTEVGFKNVTERKYAVPVNPWPPGKQLQKVGSMMALNINTILEPMSMPVFTDVLGWSPDALESLLTEVRKELADVKMHAFMTLFTVYAQKPRGQSSCASSVRSAEPP
ncbi:S-adenosyl-L-methionine-dependent methyltransferase [Xylaria cf. heliscus]|nr:S-adenosyl-L-methionine-dependent methyltransferase [Xylaria cf. heliscus]